jgi:hypothetical protein
VVGNVALQIVAANGKSQKLEQPDKRANLLQTRISWCRLRHVGGGWCKSLSTLGFDVEAEGLHTLNGRDGGLVHVVSSLQFLY